MIYKPVLFGYIASVILVVTSFVLILIMHRQDPKYERNKLMAIVGLILGSLIMNTLYFLSFFDSLTTLTAVYASVERGLDIACSYVINVFLLLYLHSTAVDNHAESDETRTSRFRKLFWPVFSIMTATFLFAAIVYITVVTDEYRVTENHILLAKTAQIILTFVICAVSTIYALAASHNVIRQKAGGKRSRSLCILILLAGFVNIVTAVYNGVQSINLFNNNSYYLNWSGIKDYNTWLFIISNLVFLLIVIWYYRTQTAALSDAASIAAQDASAALEPQIPESLGLTQREKEIVMLILDRCTYEEIAEELSISKYTVKRHVHNIYEKAGVSRRDELIKQLKAQ